MNGIKFKSTVFIKLDLKDHIAFILLDAEESSFRRTETLSSRQANCLWRGRFAIGVRQGVELGSLVGRARLRLNAELYNLTLRLWNLIYLFEKASQPSPVELTKERAPTFEGLNSIS